jgi:hypothetical protein
MNKWDEDEQTDEGDYPGEDMPYDDDEHIDWDSNGDPEGAD